jgi:potassium-dependent mechanosensitive channel
VATGQELVDWLLYKNYANNRAQAERLGQSMEEQGLLKHVTRGHPFKDAYLFYRFLVC